MAKHRLRVRSSGSGSQKRLVLELLRSEREGSSAIRKADVRSIQVDVNDKGEIQAKIDLQLGVAKSAESITLKVDAIALEGSEE